MNVAPVLFTTARNTVPTIATRTTLNVYSYADVALYGATIGTELPINDDADDTIVRATSRAACRYIGWTLTFEPQRVIPNGTLVDATGLPEASSF